MNNLSLRASFTALALTFAAAGCAVPGDRSTNNGKCPSGETCSDLTPNGLFFVGTSSADNIFGGGLPPTAKGGRQTVTALTGSGSGSPAYDGDFDAKIENTSVAEVLTVAPPSVDLRGKLFGTTRLRLLEPGTDKLLDRVDVVVQEADHAALFPQELVLVETDKTPWAVLAGSDAKLIIEVLSATGDRLVDEDLTASSSDATTTKSAWDLYKVSADKPGEITLQIKAGEASLEAKAKVVDSIDAIEIAGNFGSSMSPVAVPLDSTTILCFTARSSGTAVAGAEWTFSLPENVKPADPSDELLATLPSCVEFKGLTSGASQLTVKAGGVSKVVDLAVGAKASPYFHAAESKRLLAAHHTRLPVFGDRAFFSDAE